MKKIKKIYLSEKFYPGSDTKDEPYYELYSNIIYHFKEKPNEGCYVCLCNKGFYHSVPSGFPDYPEINMKCLNCSKEIGAVYIKNEEESENENTFSISIVKRDNYFRIFKDNEELEALKRNRDKYDKLDEINYMTLNEFKEKYILKLLNREKGLPSIDANYFKKENKIVRNLSQVSYRLLNYILYSHLFFAKMVTRTRRFDYYLPRGMTWGETISECLIFLNYELAKKGINSIEIFMNFIFKDLFNKLHDKECIDNYEELVDFEKDLEKIIEEKIELVKKEIEKYKKLMNEKKKIKILLLIY